MWCAHPVSLAPTSSAIRTAVISISRSSLNIGCLPSTSTNTSTSCRWCCRWCWCCFCLSRLSALIIIIIIIGRNSNSSSTITGCCWTDCCSVTQSGDDDQQQHFLRWFSEPTDTRFGLVGWVDVGDDDDDECSHRFVLLLSARVTAWEGTWRRREGTLSPWRPPLLSSSSLILMRTKRL